MTLAIDRRSHYSLVRSAFLRIAIGEKSEFEGTDTFIELKYSGLPKPLR